MAAEADRLAEARTGKAHWKRWGPYLSERQWGTVREDYSTNGDAWSYLSHDQARSRAYRWGEDGIAGISDDTQQLCFALAMWNGNDPILKERLFGLTNTEGNHGEDVKEYYFYLDSTPTHSWMEYLYKYPHAAFPYGDLVATNRARGYHDPEYELLDTGVFDDDRYFDVFVRYAKAGPEDLLIEIEAANRGAEPATIHLLPTLWFRNTWDSLDDPHRPTVDLVESPKGSAAVAATHHHFGTRYLYADGGPPILFTENETNRVIFGEENPTPYVKDAFHRFLVHGENSAVNPRGTGTKAAAHYVLEVAAGGSETVRLRLTHDVAKRPFAKEFDKTLAARRGEADEFYATIVPAALPDDAKRVMRQALAGMLWTKQFYAYDVTRWLREHGYSSRPQLDAAPIRNKQWFHMVNEDIISMPDKWEYPWYAAWDLAFHTVALGIVDIDFAKNQLELMLNERYLHPNGQIPAYEWNFGDVNPPVHAWAVMRAYEEEKAATGSGDLEFLRRSFNKLTLNFTWWVNRKDPDNRDVFGGGFLGLDNIGVFDRSAPLPGGGKLEQADGTAWMAFYALTMLEIAIELALHEPADQPMAAKFFEHFLWINSAMDQPDDDTHDLWDDGDGFFYDVLVFPDGGAVRMKVRSLVGLLPVAACVVIDPDQARQLPEFMDRVFWLVRHRPALVERIPTMGTPGIDDRRLLGVLDEAKLVRVLEKMLDEAEFLSPYGIRSMSKIHEQEPYVFTMDGAEFRVAYLPAESDNGMFGGNSNWRGPVWMPMNMLILRGLLQYYAYHGDELKVEFPTGSGNLLTLWEVAREIAMRLTRIFLEDASGRRPVYGGSEKFQTDPHWRDHILFFEYFNGDDGAGLGASHQTGWTGIVARLLQLYGHEEALHERLLGAEGSGSSALAG